MNSVIIIKNVPYEYVNNAERYSTHTEIFKVSYAPFFAVELTLGIYANKKIIIVKNCA